MSLFKKYSECLKRGLVVLLAVITVMSLASCGGDSGASDVPNGEAVADTDYDITFYWGPTANDFTEEEIIRMKEAGFDTVPIQRFPDNPRKIKEVVQLLEKHGLNAMVHDRRIDKLVTDNVSKKSTVKETVKEVVDYYADCPNITEWSIADEPNASKFNVIKWIVEAFREYSPNTKTFVNLFPSYAPSEMLGVDTYEEYIDSFCEKVNPHYLSVDHYAFFGDPNTTEVRDDFYYNLELVKQTGAKYNIETRFIMLVSQHAIYSNVTKEELTLQANLTLLYGMKGLSWFTYSHENGYSQELVDVNGNTTQHYDEVKEVNVGTHSMGNALYNTNVKNVYSLGLSESYAKKGLTAYSGDAYTGANALVSEYENGYIMVMNGRLMDGVNATVTVKGLAGMQWLNTETNTWENLSSCPYVKEGDSTTLELPFSVAVLLRNAL